MCVGGVVLFFCVGCWDVFGFLIDCLVIDGFWWIGNYNSLVWFG